MKNSLTHGTGSLQSLLRSSRKPSVDPDSDDSKTLLQSSFDRFRVGSNRTGNIAAHAHREH